MAHFLTHPIGLMSMAAQQESQDSVETNFAVSLLEFKNAQLHADKVILDNLILLWPDSCPSEDHTEIVWTFARLFMAWRDAVIRINCVGFPNESAEDTVPDAADDLYRLSGKTMQGMES
ncbi:hypothetical protein B0H14DRAFT_3503542 [Mycena olivaceomarginata]|nr:hypothetical protein B0H14DRAFT_3503542 [Mycena olivaceomarginata]